MRYTTSAEGYEVRLPVTIALQRNIHDETGGNITWDYRVLFDGRDQYVSGRGFKTRSAALNAGKKAAREWAARWSRSVR